MTMVNVRNLKKIENIGWPKIILRYTCVSVHALK